MTSCQKRPRDDDAVMSSLTPKQLEIRQREARILSVATPMIRDGGLEAIRMDRIAKEMRLTRGTIYNHFANREEIVLSLAGRAIQRRIALFEYAISLADQSRRQIAAVGIACEVYADQMPDDFAAEQMVRHDSVLMKTSEARRGRLLADEHACMAVVGQAVVGAVERGDLKVPRGQDAPDVLFGLWSLVYGGLLIEATSPSLTNIGISDSRSAIRRNCNALLDGLHWQPPYEASAYNRWVKQIHPKLVDQSQQILLATEVDS